MNKIFVILPYVFAVTVLLSVGWEQPVQAGQLTISESNTVAYVRPAARIYVPRRVYVEPRVYVPPVTVQPQVVVPPAEVVTPPGEVVVPRRVVPPEVRAWDHARRVDRRRAREGWRW